MMSTTEWERLERRRARGSEHAGATGSLHRLRPVRDAQEPAAKVGSRESPGSRPPAGHSRAALAGLEQIARSCELQLRHLPSPERPRAGRGRRRAFKPEIIEKFLIPAARACLQKLRSAYAFIVLPNATSLGEEADWASKTVRRLEQELRTGLRVLLVAAAFFGGWAALVPLSAAVAVGGTLVVKSSLKSIQHPTGGVVAKILAHDGLHVSAGDLLVSLDPTQVRANLQVINQQLDEIRVRMARLLAERDGTGEFSLPPALSSRANSEQVDQLFKSEASLFSARASARNSQKELLRTHISQLGDEIAGLDTQIKSKAAQLELISTELKGVQGLYDKSLVPLTRLTTLQREQTRLEGERGQLLSAVAQSKSKISEAELEIVRVDQDSRAEVTKDLREAQDKEAELVQRSVAAQDQLDRIDIRAPTSGVIHQLAAHTIGGVIQPAEVIMQIVPDGDDLQVEARLRPNDIDQVHVGQSAAVQFPAFNRRTTPRLAGSVTYVSPDLTSDKQTSFYTVRVNLPAEEVHRLGALQLVSGMPVEVLLQTGSRTMLSYLFKPITDQLGRTFIER